MLRRASRVIDVIVENTVDTAKSTSTQLSLSKIKRNPTQLFDPTVKLPSNIKLKRNIFENSPKSDIQVYPGSIIFVPRKIDDSSSKTLVAQAYVTILGNLGLALASLSSISND